MASPLNQFNQRAKSFKQVPLNKSTGILDDFAVRKVMNSREGTIEKAPTADNDIINKAYADGFVAGIAVSSGIIYATNGFEILTAGQAGIRIPANSYAFGINAQPTSGLYFDNVSPKNISLHISGTQKHVFYMGGGPDQGAFYHLPRTSAPNNATAGGTLYVHDNGDGTYTLKIRNTDGSGWVNV